MMKPEDFLSIQEVLSWFLYPQRHTSDLSGCPLKLSVTYQQENIFICDMRIKIKGCDEENIFLNNKTIRLNIRRGNSMLLVLNKGFEAAFLEKIDGKGDLNLEDISEAHWIRRGLVKFFDINLDEMSQILKGIKKGLHNASSGSTSHKITFTQIESALANGKAIEVYQTQKANGENVQICYCKVLEKWVISSKNCSIAARDRDEIENFKDKRYSFAKLIAGCWFKTVEKLQELQALADLKIWIDGKTMIGEYVGNKEFEHIIKYSEEEILFYAITDNNSGFSALPVIESYFIFKRFGLKTVGVNKVGRFFNRAEMYEQLVRVFNDISREKINSGGEGSVLYFCKNSFTDYNMIDTIEQCIFNGQLDDLSEQVHAISSCQSTLSLGKIKTLDYRIFRKIREKVKNLKMDKTNQTQTKEKFMKECKDLLEHFEVPEKFDYFLGIYERVSALILRKMKESGDTTKTKKTKENMNFYVNLAVPNVFLETSWAVNIGSADIEKAIPMKYIGGNYVKTLEDYCLFHNCINDHFFPKVEFGCYYFVGFSQEDEDDFLKKTEEFKEAKDYPQELLKFNSKQGRLLMKDFIHEHFELRRSQFKTFIFPESAVVRFLSSSSQILEIIKNDLGIFEKKTEVPKLKIIIFLTIAIPGAGKSYIKRHITTILKNQKNTQYRLIECDDLRAKKIAELKKELINLSDKQLFDLSSEGLTSSLKEQILSSMKNVKRPGLFYIDRNFSFSSIKLLKESLLSEGHNLILVGLVPESNQFDSAKSGFVLSFNFLATCMKRVLKRGGHKVMTQENPIDRLRVVIEIYKKLNKKSLNACVQILDSCVSIPMVNENEQFLEEYQKAVISKAVNMEDLIDEQLQEVFQVLEGFEVKETEFGDEIIQIFQKTLRNYGII